MLRSAAAQQITAQTIAGISTGAALAISGRPLDVASSASTNAIAPAPSANRNARLLNVLPSITLVPASAPLSQECWLTFRR